VRACLQKNVTFRFGVDVRRNPELLAPFDRIVIATGARYRFGLGPIAKFMLDTGLARWRPLRDLFARPALRDWFYFEARRGSDDDIRRLAKPSQAVITIGDARKAGKSKEAIASAFSAALSEHHPRGRWRVS
jgi:hypothetical protein